VPDTKPHPLETSEAGLPAERQQAMEEKEQHMSTAVMNNTTTAMTTGSNSDADGAASRLRLGAQPRLRLGAQPRLRLGAQPRLRLGAQPRLRLGAQPRLRLTARGRAVFTGLAAIPVVVGVMLFALNGGGATATSSSGELELVTVQAGQSLWQLAEEIAPETDPRDVISDILAVNDLETGSIQAGQRIALPARYSAE
jgi:hypothetical protein